MQTYIALRGRRLRGAENGAEREPAVANGSGYSG
jgi:hypothetical protein